MAPPTGAAQTIGGERTDLAASETTQVGGVKSVLAAPHAEPYGDRRAF
jgi:hypothetical protein